MDAVRFHYDVGNDFFSLWLDRRLTYSCALFPESTTAADAPRLLDAAQEAKLERICRKLRLGANRRLLDIGSGWGSLVTYAGERHAALAVGITLSEPQAARAEAQARGAGLVGRVHTGVRDYRDLAPLGPFDAVASVGMVEHVGRANLPAFYRAAFDAVRPGGLVLSHGIMDAGRPAPRLGPDLRPARSHFVDRYVFPDKELLRVEEHVARAREAGFEVIDVESLGPHYALTLAAWVARLEARWPEAVAAAGEEVARTWRLYMSAGRLAFERGDLDVAQLLLVRPGEDGRVSLPPAPWW
jgi:cyclopropane-fatty-acyl-phospholipid synthase